MSLPATPPGDLSLPALLRQLLQQFKAEDDAGQRATLHAIGSQRSAAARTVVGALCLGGAGFAARLVAHGHDALTPDDHLALVLDAFCTVVDAPPDAPDDHERRVAEQLIADFELPASAQALLDTARAEFLIAAGPLEQVPEAALAAMRHSQWELALRGFVRVQQALHDKAPRNAFGMAALCLHKLGRYAEAEVWANQGLGDLQALLAIGPVHSEAGLLRQWSGRRSPVVSILCTAFNHERYIESAIRGFLSQAGPYPFEILIHDDASTDGTQQIIREWQQRYPNVIRTVLQTENQYSKGGRPFEILLAQARGEFVATCEGDDFWVDPHKLQRQVGFLKANPDFSCSAHNYYHYLEAGLTVKPWTRMGRNFVLSRRQLMGLVTVLWLPTLVFRRTFSVLPPERGLAAIGDQFLTSYLGTQGRCMYFETVLGAVRRENEFSIWSPLPKAEKERRRVKTWAALVRMHERMGNTDAVTDLMAKVTASPLDPQAKTDLLDASRSGRPGPLADPPAGPPAHSPAHSAADSPADSLTVA
jgi:Glycosyl transferase family 2